MKKLLFLVMAMFSFVSQAQTEFDFSCAAKVDVTIRLRYKGTFPHSSDDYLSVKHAFVSGEAKSTTVSFTLPDGYATSSSHDIGNSNNNFYKIALNPSSWANNATVIYVKVTLHGNFSYNTSDFTVSVLGESYIDYTTPPPPDSVTIKVKFAEGFTHDVVFVEGGSIVEADVPLPSGWSLESQILQYPTGTGFVIGGPSPAVPSVAWSRSARSTSDNTVGIRLRPAKEILASAPAFDYTQADFVYDVSQHYEEHFNIPEVVETIKLWVNLGSQTIIYNGVATVPSNGYTTVSYTVPFNHGYRVIEAIEASSGWSDPDVPGATFKISERAVGSKSVGVTVYLDQDVFNYTPNEATINVSPLFAGKFGVAPALSDVEDGNLEDIINYNSGSPTIVPKSSNAVIRSKFKITDDAWGIYRSWALTDDNVTHTFGSSKVHEFSGNLDVAAGSSSSWQQWSKDIIVGGDYDGYTKIPESDNTYDVFVKWTDGSKAYKVMVITRHDFNYSGGTKTAGDPFFEMRSFKYGTMRHFGGVNNVNGTPIDISNEERELTYKWEVGDNQSQTEDAHSDIYGSSRVGSIGDSQVIYWGGRQWNADDNPLTEYSSTDSAFDDRRIYGGKYHGYVFISQPWNDQVQFFGKWGANDDVAVVVALVNKNNDSSTEYSIFNGSGRYDMRTIYLIPGDVVYNYGCKCYNTY